MTVDQMQSRTAGLFDATDADGDGVVAAAELAAAVEAGDRGVRRLARADADGDGRITRAESRAMVAALFARLDADGDGTVTPDERPQRPGGDE